MVQPLCYSFGPKQLSYSVSLSVNSILPQFHIPHLFSLNSALLLHSAYPSLGFVVISDPKLKENSLPFFFCTTTPLLSKCCRRRRCQVSRCCSRSRQPLSTIGHLPLSLSLSRFSLAPHSQISGALGAITAAPFSPSPMSSSHHPSPSHSLLVLSVLCLLLNLVTSLSNSPLPSLRGAAAVTVCRHHRAAAAASKLVSFSLSVERKAALPSVRTQRRCCHGAALLFALMPAPSSSSVEITVASAPLPVSTPPLLWPARSHAAFAIHRRC